MERLDGMPILEATTEGAPRDTVEALLDAGFARTPKGLRLR